MYRNAQAYNAGVSEKIQGWKQFHKMASEVITFEDFLVDASDEPDSYLLPQRRETPRLLWNHFGGTRNYGDR
jgi:hypothetical protein